MGTQGVRRFAGLCQISINVQPIAVSPQSPNGFLRELCAILVLDGLESQGFTVPMDMGVEFVAVKPSIDNFCWPPISYFTSRTRDPSASVTTVLTRCFLPS
jgi:hypothetical protein